MSSLTERYGASLMNTFGPPKRVLVRGEGATVWDDAGTAYVDLLGGIAVNALGHAHPALVEAVTTQLQTLGHVSNFFATEPQVRLAERLADLLRAGAPDGRAASGQSRPDPVGPAASAASGQSRPDIVGRAASVASGQSRPDPVGRAASAASGQSRPDIVGRAASAASGQSRPLPVKVFFTNSGAEANEAALKLTRRTGRRHVVATEGAFHGRTMGALSLTAKAGYREPFEPLPGGVTFVPYGDAAALAAVVTHQTAAVVLEPLQGEAGVETPPRDYLARARDITADHGALLWLDEIQTGIGRTGAWFAHQHPEVADPLPSPPDVVTVAKGLGGGFPIGACLATGAAADLLEPGSHGTTFGGNPVAAAAALAVLDTLEKEGLLEHAEQLGRRLRDGLAADDRVTEVRGSGLLLGLDLSEDRSAEVFAAALEAGFILNNPTPRRIRLAPPLVLTDAQAESFLAAWPTILDAAYGRPR